MIAFYFFKDTASQQKFASHRLFSPSRHDHRDVLFKKIVATDLAYRHYDIGVLPLIVNALFAALYVPLPAGSWVARCTQSAGALSTTSEEQCAEDGLLSPSLRTAVRRIRMTELTESLFQFSRKFSSLALPVF